MQALNAQGQINEFTRLAIIDMTKKVVEHIAKKYEQIQKGVNAVMGGKVLEYEAKTILNKGLQEGLEKGLEEGLEKGLAKGLTQGLEKGKITAYAEMIRDGFISITEAAARLNLPVEKLEEFLKNNH